MRMRRIRKRWQYRRKKVNKTKTKACGSFYVISTVQFPVNVISCFNLYYSTGIRLMYLTLLGTFNKQKRKSVLYMSTYSSIIRALLHCRNHYLSVAATNLSLKS